MTDRELLQQALHALETVFMPHHPAVIALRERLAREEPHSPEPITGINSLEQILPAREEQEPVAHLWQHSETGRTRIVMPDQIVTADATWHVVGPLYLAPPARHWQGLTDEEIGNFVSAVWPREATPADYIRAIEAKLREKNA